MWVDREAAPRAAGLGMWVDREAAPQAAGLGMWVDREAAMIMLGQVSQTP